MGNCIANIRSHAVDALIDMAFSIAMLLYLPETTGGKFVVADQKIAGRNKAHCIYIQNKAEN
jgi:hypothetical protein